MNYKANHSYSCFRYNRLVVYHISAADPPCCNCTEENQRNRHPFPAKFFSTTTHGSSSSFSLCSQWIYALERVHYDHGAHRDSILHHSHSMDTETCGETVRSHVIFSCLLFVYSVHHVKRIVLLLRPRVYTCTFIHCVPCDSFAQ